MTRAEDRAMATIVGCDDPQKIKTMIRNARNAGNGAVERAAMLRLYEVQPSAEPGTLEHDVWRSIYALEGALSRERGKTTLLGRTRQKVARHGEQRTVADLVKGEPSGGFQMLLDRDMVDHTFEAVALRHPDRFDEAVLIAAAARISAIRRDAAPSDEE